MDMIQKDSEVQEINCGDKVMGLITTKLDGLELITAYYSLGRILQFEKPMQYIDGTLTSEGIKFRSPNLNPEEQEELKESVEKLRMNVSPQLVMEVLMLNIPMKKSTVV